MKRVTGRGLYFSKSSLLRIAKMTQVRAPARRIKSPQRLREVPFLKAETEWLMGSKEPMKIIARPIFSRWTSLSFRMRTPAVIVITGPMVETSRPSRAEVLSKPMKVKVRFIVWPKRLRIMSLRASFLEKGFCFSSRLRKGKMTRQTRKSLKKSRVKGGINCKVYLMTTAEMAQMAMAVMRARMALRRFVTKLV